MDRYPFSTAVDLVFNNEVVAFYLGTPFCNFMVRGFLFRDQCHRMWDSSEAFFMYQKLLFHGQGDLATYVYEHSDCPGICKSIGRRIPNYNEVAWSRARYQAMVKAVTLKFVQNPDLAALLLGTGDRIMVEASPIDPWWGVGMGTDHPEILRPSTWRGTNLLGLALMDVRRLLRVMYRKGVTGTGWSVPPIGSRRYEQHMMAWYAGQNPGRF